MSRESSGEIVFLFLVVVFFFQLPGQVLLRALFARVTDPAAERADHGRADGARSVPTPRAKTPRTASGSGHRARGGAAPRPIVVETAGRGELPWRRPGRPARR